MMKTLFIKKLAPANKDYVLSQEPDSLNTAPNTVRAMWKRKNPTGGEMHKVQKLTMSPITSEIENTLKTYLRRSETIVVTVTVWTVTEKLDLRFTGGINLEYLNPESQKKFSSVRPSVRASVRPSIGCLLVSPLFFTQIA
jgi:hypothetical protein